MRQTERGLMLLCLPLGDTLAGALSLAQARELSKRARAIGIGEDDPLRADAVIVDETSMVDVPLMAALLAALRNGWTGFMSGAQAVAVFFVGAWPAILIGAVCGVIYYRVRHPRKKK